MRPGDSDQPVNSNSLIRIFAGRIVDSQGCKDSSCGQPELKSVCADAQAGLSPGWMHMSEGTFSHVAVLCFFLTHLCPVDSSTSSSFPV